MCLLSSLPAEINVAVIVALGATGAVFTVTGFIILTVIAGYFQRNGNNNI